MADLQGVIRSMNFPAVDPIPVPAPVWLMKLLSLLTLSLHFAAVMILVGSLLLVIGHNFLGRTRKNSTNLTVAAVLARRLTVVMTYVINLGVPPLLFLQVLYGPAIYTSSVLIAVMWISVIFQLILAYWLLYRTQVWIAEGRAAWILAFGALMIVLGIGQIYSMNMTLMLRPEVWRDMYAHSPNGLQGVSGDPTTTPRWLFVMSGGLVFGGLWAVLHANLQHLDAAVRTSLARSGGQMSLIGGAVQAACGFWVYQRQPAAVQEGIGAAPLLQIGGILCLAGILAGAMLGGIQGLRAKATPALAILGGVLAFVGNAGGVIVRDGIRDLTMKPKGYDVWSRTEASNWTVIVVFLLLFIFMLGVVVWLLRVMSQAAPIQEQVSR